MCGATYLVVEPDPLEVHGHHRVPLVLGQVERRRQREDTGVRAEDVDPAEGLDRGLCHALAVVGLRHVGLDANGLPAERLNLSNRPLEIVLGRHPLDPVRAELGGDIGDRDIGALTGEKQRHRPAEAASASGDQRPLPVELGHRPPFGPTRSQASRSSAVAWTSGSSRTCRQKWHATKWAGSISSRTGTSSRERACA